MRAEGYSISVVRQVDLGPLGVDGTPTLLLADQEGKLQQKWVGKLSRSQEDEVAEALGLGRLSDRVTEKAAAVASSGGEWPAGNTQDSAVSAAQGELPSEGLAGMKTVRIEDPFPDDPVRVIQVLEGDTDVTPGGRDPVTGRTYKRWNGKPFQAGDDWLKNLVVVMKNVSNKVIVAASVTVDVPQVGNEIPGKDKIYVSDMWKTFYLGSVPEHALFTRDGRKIELPPAEPIWLMPGQEIRFALESHLDEMKEAMRPGRSISSVTTCWVRLHYFYFADATRWSSFSGFQKPDFSVPGKYVRISVDEFRGGTPPAPQN